MTPVEAIAAAVCSGPRFGGGPAPCEVCRGRAVQDVAALTAQGKVIVDVSDLVAAITVLATADDTCTDAACWREACQLLARLRAALPDVVLEPSGTLQGEQATGPGISGRSDDPKAAEGLSALREELWQHRVAADVLGTLLREEEEASSRARTRAEHAEEALDAAQQTIARTVRYAIAQHAYRPVEAGSLAAVLLNIDPHDIDPDEAIRALETQGASLAEEKPHA